LHLNPNTGFGAIESVCEGESALCKKNDARNRPAKMPRNAWRKSMELVKIRRVRERQRIRSRAAAAVYDK